jgi:hypothetical protein
LQIDEAALQSLELDEAVIVATCLMMLEIDTSVERTKNTQTFQRPANLSINLNYHQLPRSMLKKEIDRRRLIQFALIGGAGGS